MVKIAAIIAGILVFLGLKSKEDKPKVADPFPTEAYQDVVKDTEYVPYTPINFEKTTSSLDDLYKKYGQRHGLDWKLLKAIAQVESNENPKAKNPTDPSFGLMQLLCRPNGAGGCSNKLNVLDWPPEHHNKLYDPDYSVYIGAQILAWNIDRYGLWRGVACYNHWGARLAEPDGPFPNQRYVDKVQGKYNALSGSQSGYGL